MGTQLVVAGPATGPLMARRRRRRRCSGCASGSASPGARSGCPRGEFVDATCRSPTLWGDEVDERVAAGGTPALLDIVRERLRGMPIDPLARAAALGDGPPGRAGGRAGATLGVSERQLRRRFADAVGYGPKTLARVLRFQRFLQLLGLTRRGVRRSRRVAALAAGYADQRLTSTLAEPRAACRPLTGRRLLAGGRDAGVASAPACDPSKRSRPRLRVPCAR